MPRDPSGNYTLPALGNPAVTQTPITIAWWNGTSTDMASTLTDSLSRSGLGGMLVPFTLVDGTTTAPAFAFQSETNTGLYRFGPGEMDVVVGGTRFTRWTSGGFQGSVDGGATWKFPIYQNLAGQSITSGTVDFTLGTLLVGSLPLRVPLVTKSSSCGTFTTASTSLVAVTNLSVTFTANGNPVFVQLVSDDSGSDAAIGGNITGAWSEQITLALTTDAGSTFFARQSHGANIIGAAGTPIVTFIAPATSYSTWFAPSAGSVTVKCYVKTNATQANVSNAKLCVTQF